ncbi:facilitated trehalose transporter Tret1 [Penaeus vannamei]|uniref:facilitated trehalose transporter Tret1 n=1 Tax=Penaeus vannamei TaxID=6689 RepID=UPI00387F6D3B
MEANERERDEDSPSVTTNSQKPTSPAGNPESDGAGRAERNVKARRITQYLAATAACLGAACSGAVMGFSAPAGPQLIRNASDSSQNDSDADNALMLTSLEYSWFSSLPNLAAAAVGPFAGLAMNKIGRRGTMLASVAPFVVGWVLICLAGDLWTLLAGRLVTGFTMGTMSVVCPTFIGEFATPDVRGLLGSGFQLFATLGLLGVYVVGSAVEWRVLAGTCVSVPLLFGLASLFIQESPSFLLQKGRDSQAEKSLRWYRGSDYNVKAELEATKKNLQELQAGGRVGLRGLGRPCVLRPLLVSLGLMFFQQLCGINAILFNANTVFQDSGSRMGRDASSVVVAATQVLGTLLASFLMDRTGRKVLLLLSSVVMTLALAALGAYFVLKEKDADFATSALGWLPLAGLVAFIAAFALAFGPIPWLMMGELFPRDAREIAGSLASAFNWSLSFLVTLTFLPLQEAIGSAAVYWTFAVVCISSFIFCLSLVPETKGRTLEEITQMFSDSGKDGAHNAA